MSSSAPDLQPVRCFVGLYGMNRSLEKTWRSIQSKILAPLRTNGLEPIVVAHFHQPAAISNIRSGEFGVVTKDRGYRHLKLADLRIDPQETRLLDPSIIPLLDPVFDGDTAEDCQNRRNLLFQLRSLKEVWSLMLSRGAARNDLVLFLRPDLRYLDTLDVESTARALSTDGYDIMTANWHEWGGLNDRFAFCNTKGAAVVAARGTHALDFAARHGCLDAEKLLKEAVEQGQLRHRHTSMRAVRVRADGLVLREGFDFGFFEGASLRIGNGLVNARRRLRHAFRGLS